MYIITNIDNIQTIISSDTEFLKKVQSIAKENDDFEYEINTVSGAIEYLNAYCPDLSIEIK